MSNVLRTLVVALALLSPLPASAHGWRVHSRSVTVAYYPVVSVVAYQPYPILVASPLLVCPPPLAGVPAVPSAPNYAQPTPAPPSGTPPPTAPAPGPQPAPPPTTPGLPLPPPSAPATPLPKVSDSSTSYYNAYALAPRATDQPASGRCSVALWNLTGRTITLKLDGQSQVLASGQRVARDLPREFVWQIEGRDPQRHSVPAGEAGVEIVLRQ